jgi:FtsK/SpoIIIE family
VKVTRSDLVTAAAVPSLVSGAALIADQVYGASAATVELIAAVAAGKLCLASFTRSWSDSLSWGSLVVSAASAEAFFTGAVGGFAPVYGWVVGATAVFWTLVKYRHETRHDRVKTDMDAVRLETALIRMKMAHHKLTQATVPELARPEPVLTGRTPEETRIRTVVHELFAAELLGCTVERTRTGWTAVLDLPVNLDRAKLRAGWPRVASGLGVQGEFALSDGALTNQLVARFIEGDPLSAVVPYERTPGSRFTEPVLLGVDRFLNQVWLDLAYSHTLVAGSSKFGKSTLTRSVVVQLAERPDVVLYGMDLKPGAPELTPMLPVLQDLAQTPEQAHALLDWLRRELDERGEILASAGDQEWDPQRHGRPALWVIQDELAELVRQGDVGEWKKNPASKKQESLLALMRFAGMHMLSATQQPSRKVFGGATDARGNYSIRLSTRMNDPDHRRFVFGNTPGWEPGKLDAPGKFLLQSPDHQVPAPYKGMWLTGDEFKAEVARIGATTVRAPVGKRLILPVPGKTHQGKVRAALAKYGNMTRPELETATGLKEKQVLDSLAALRPDIERCEDTKTWRIVPSGAWEAQAVSKG